MVYTQVPGTLGLMDLCAQTPTSVLLPLPTPTSPSEPTSPSDPHHQVRLLLHSPVTLSFPRRYVKTPHFFPVCTLHGALSSLLISWSQGISVNFSVVALVSLIPVVSTQSGRIPTTPPRANVPLHSSYHGDRGGGMISFLAPLSSERRPTSSSHLTLSACWLCFFLLVTSCSQAGTSLRSRCRDGRGVGGRGDGGGMVATAEPHPPPFLLPSAQGSSCRTTRSRLVTRLSSPGQGQE